MGGRAGTIARAKKLSEELIQSGQALEKFRQMVALQGGDAGVIDDPGRLPRAKYALDVLSSRSGYVSAIQCEAVGTACVILGGGREKKEDSVDPAVGIILHKKVADRVAVGEPLCTMMYNAETRAAPGEETIDAKLSNIGLAACSRKNSSAESFKTPMQTELSATADACSLREKSG